MFSTKSHSNSLMAPEVLHIAPGRCLSLIEVAALGIALGFAVVAVL